MQWTHRVLGTLLLLAVLVVAVRVARRVAEPTTRRFALALGAGVALQYALGILTLVHIVPVSLGVLHQLTAALLFGTWIAWLHHFRNTRAQPA